MYCDRVRSGGGRHLLDHAGTTLALTSSRIYETGVKQLFWDSRAEWTLSIYDITRQNVYVAVTNTDIDAGRRNRTKGVEFAAAVRPVDG